MEERQTQGGRRRRKAAGASYIHISESYLRAIKGREEPEALADAEGRRRRIKLRVLM